MFQLEYHEVTRLRSQLVTLKKERGQHRKYLPYVFTEQGVAMLSTVLNSERAIQVNIAIMRAFVQLRAMATQYEGLLRKVEAMERKYDAQFKAVFEAIKQLMQPTPPKKQKDKIGFRQGTKHG